MKLRGRAHKFGKNVDTDVIIPGKYCNIVDQAEALGLELGDADGGLVFGDGGHVALIRPIRY